MTSTSGVGSPGTVSGASGNKVYAINNVSTVFTQVLPGNTQRVSMTWHNPGTIILYIGPLALASGANQTPNLGNLGGTFQLLPGATMTFTGECQTGWGALSASAANNPLTIMDSNL
jgi:hypothetical protein